MDAAAPEAAEPREEAEAATDARKRAWWRLKIPTTVIVTLVGIALTAWLLPAFTRQWDDRQKAQALKADLATQIAAATSQTLVQSTVQARLLESKLYSPQRDRWTDIRQSPLQRAALSAEDRLRNLWLRGSIAIDARLRAYFTSRDVFDALRRFDRAIASL
jgi:hypothetical protein